uniref:HAD-IC family P-type ATPase n=1 Tax=Candidatus Entotheonella palauensis TaxID=93172 RepID=UPI001177FC2D
GQKLSHPPVRRKRCSSFSGIGDTIRISAPVSVLNFLRLSSNEGILIKDGRVLELLSKVDTIVFDKTGTLTQEIPYVGAVYTTFGTTENQVLRIAATAEHKQIHPIAQAIVKEAQSWGLTLPEAEETAYEMGYGLKVIIDQNVVLVGSQRFMSRSGVTIPAGIRSKQAYSNDHGYSLVYVAINAEVCGAIELHPTISPEVIDVINTLKKRELEIVMMSGDHEAPTRELAAQLGIDQYFAQTLPEDKAELIAGFQEKGKTVCFIGDGINDSIALKTANVSLSLSGASSMAIDTAGIILMDGSVNRLPALLNYAKRLDGNMKVNFLTSIVPGVVIIGGAFFFHFSILGAIALNNVGLLAGMANAMRPMISSGQQPQDRVFGASQTATSKDDEPMA